MAAANVGQEAAPDAEQVRRAALGNSPAARPAFVPKPVVITHLDIARYIDELASLDRLASNKTSPALDGLALGTFGLRHLFSSLFLLRLTFLCLVISASSSIRNGVPITGKVLTIDASVDNMRTFVRCPSFSSCSVISPSLTDFYRFQFEARARLYDKALVTVARLLQQPEEGVDSKIFDILATIASDMLIAMTFTKAQVPKSSKLAVSLPLFHVKMMPALKAVIQVKSLPHYTRLMVCRMIEDMEQWQVQYHLDTTSDFAPTSIPSPNAPILDLITGATSNPKELSTLRCKFALICDAIRETHQSSSSESSSTKAIYHKMSLQSALDVFESTPATLLDSIFDLTLTCFTYNAPFSTLISHLEAIRDATQQWSELDRLLLRSKLVDLSRILIAQQRPSELVDAIFRLHIPATLAKITYGAANVETWSVGSATKAIEIFCVSLERELEVAFAAQAISNILEGLSIFFEQLPIATATPSSTQEKGVNSLRRSFGARGGAASSSHSTELLPPVPTSTKTNTATQVLELRDLTMRRALDYAIWSFNAYHPAVLLNEGFTSILTFVNEAFGEALKYDCGLLSNALHLASLFVQQKSDANSLVSFFQNHMLESFAVLLPWTLSVPSSRMLRLYMDILEFGYLCVQAGNTNRYKFFSWFMPPVYSQVASLSITDAEKADTVSEIITTCSTSLKKGNDIDLLLRDGVPMVLTLFSSGDAKLIVPTLRTVTSKLMQSGSFWTLLQMNFCLATAHSCFGAFASAEAIDNFFRYLISKGQRKMVNAANEVLVKHLARNQYFGLRDYIFATFEPDLIAFQNQPIPEPSEELIEIQDRSHVDLDSEPVESLEVSVPAKYKVKPETKLSPDEISDLLGLLASVFAVDRHDKGVLKIIYRLLQDVLTAIEERRFKAATVDEFRDRLSRVLLFKNLFPQVLKEHAESSSPDALAQLFNDTFPADVVRDAPTMEVLAMLGTRIERVNTQLPKFQHVATAAADLLNLFLSWKPAPDMTTLESQVYHRRRFLNDHVFNLPANVALRTHLISVGYHPDLFAKNLEIRVDVDDRRNLDDLFKTSLSNLYVEYLDIIKELYPNIKTIHYEGADVPLEDFFVENHRTSFKVEDLRSRRNHALNMIQKKLKNHLNRVNLQNRKLSILTREESLEDQLEKDKQLEGLSPPQRRRYWVRLNNTFWNVAACCGKQISGCYAPNGDHAEKILENALKTNVAILSLYESKADSGSGKKKKKAKNKKHKDKSDAADAPVEDEDDEEEEEGPGLEIENIEVVYTDQGMFIFKLYTNGHNLDTTLAWLQFFKLLASSRLVPALIIPNNFPTVRIFNQLENFIPTQIAGSIITYKDSYFDDFGVTSYYDIPIEKVKMGDLLLDDEASQQIVISENVDLHQDGLKSSGSRSRLVESTSLDVAAINDKEAEKMKAKQRRTKLQQDFSGVTLTATLRRVKQKVQDDPILQPFAYTIEAFVRYISQYLSQYLEKGVRDPSLIAVGLEVETWNRRKQVKNNQAQLTEEIKMKLVRLIAQTVQEELEQWLEPEALCRLFCESRSQFFELRTHWQQFETSQYLETDEGKAISAELLAQRKEDAKVAKRALSLARQMMAELQTTISYDQIPRQPQEQLIKWIFGNEDRVWRERGGRPGEETLTTFLNFCRAYEDDAQQLTQAQQQVRLSSQAQRERDAAAAAAAQANTAQNAMTDLAAPSAAPSAQPLSAPASNAPQSSSTDDSEEEGSSPLTSFKGHHYGQVPFGGFLTLATVPSTSDASGFASMVNSATKNAKGSGSSNQEIAAYAIGDYIAADDFEVITAWVHPQYRSFGLAMDLYKRIAYRVWQEGGKFVTFDVLLGTVEHLTRTVPSLALLQKLGILQRIILKRRASHSSDTEHGTERFERLTMSLRWLVLAFSLVDMCKKFLAWFYSVMPGYQSKKYPWTTWFSASQAEQVYS